MKSCASICLVIYFVSSTDQIYQLAASLLSDKFDPSMTLGKLLDNNAQLFIFISKMIMMITARMYMMWDRGIK